MRRVIEVALGAFALIAALGAGTVRIEAPASAATAQRTVLAAADGAVDASAPSRPFATATELPADADPARASYLRFVVAGLGGAVTRAELRLHVRDRAWAPSASGGTISRVTGGTSWTEASLTWPNRPAIGAAIASSGPVALGRWVSFDITAAVTGAGTVELALTSTSTDGVAYDSRETGALGPQLVLTVESAPTADPVLWAAGDIARCNSSSDEATAALLDGTVGPIAVLGDLAYPGSGPTDLASCFGPSWGRHRDRLRPVPGNHEYLVDGAAPYFDWFGTAAGTRGQGWYSYDVGSWHLVALNSNCAAVGGCGSGSPQETWLRADLAATAKPCIAAYWHHPLFTSSTGESASASVAPLWRALQTAGADVILNGHAHGYERYARQRADGVADPAGPREFVVGTGGMTLYPFKSWVDDNSVARDAASFGVLKLVLRPTSYQWSFVPVAGSTYADTGSTACH